MAMSIGLMHKECIPQMCIWQLKYHILKIYYQTTTSISSIAAVNQNVMCIQYVVKHNLVLDGMLIY